jgi:hypothetical protein
MLQVLQEGPAMCLLPRAWGQRRCSQGRGLGLRHSLGPVRLQQGGVVDNGRKQGREGPEEQSWEELANDWVLEDKVHGRRVTGAVALWTLGRVLSSHRPSVGLRTGKAVHKCWWDNNNGTCSFTHAEIPLI